MAIRNPPRKKPNSCRVEMAVRAVETNYSPSDLPMGGFDPSPIALGLDDGYESEMCSKPRCTPPAQGTCGECGQPVCGGCA